MPTLREIASETGLSVATVSRALQADGKASDKTRQKVLLSMQKLSQRNAGAFSNGTIGLILTDSENPFYDEAIRIIDQELHTAGYCLLCIITNDHANSAAYLRQLCQQGVKGIIWLNPCADDCEEALAELQSAHIPVVQAFNAHYPALDSAVFGDKLGVYTITRTLLRQYGHERILFVGAHDTMHYKGYEKAYREAGLEPFGNGGIQIPEVKNQAAFIRDAIRQCGPTAVISHTEYNTVETMRACRMMGLRIPEDISMIAYDDYPWLSMMEISAIYHPLDEFGKNVCQLLEQRLEGDAAQQKAALHLVVEPHIILRDSVRVLR